MFYCVLRIAYCVLRIAYCVLRIAYCVLRIAYCMSVTQLRTTGCGLLADHRMDFGDCAIVVLDSASYTKRH